MPVVESARAHTSVLFLNTHLLSHGWARGWTRGSSSLGKESDHLGEKSPKVASLVGRNYKASASSLHAAPDGHLSTCVVQHWFFRNFINFVIILAVIQMGLEVQFSGPEFKLPWRIWNIFYTVVSTIEMLLMVEAYRLVYFQSRWMLLDFALTIVTILDTIVFPAAEFDGVVEEYVSLLRLLRVLRILKVTRVFPGFAVIIDGLIQSFQSMFWIFGLMVLILYAGSICCVKRLGGPDAGFPDYNEGSAKSNMIAGFNNYEHFGTLFRSMLTLLSMLLLSEWPVVRKVAEVHTEMVPVFLLLLVLVSFGVTNVIIGIVVEKTTEAMSAPAEAEIVRDMEFKAELFEELAQLLYEIDDDKDGHASLNELERGLTRPELAAKLEGLDLPYGFTGFEFLNMIDANGDGKLSKHEFVVGLMRLISSTDWQRQCLHAMEFGKLHNSMKTLKKNLVTELRNSVRELQSEIRTLMYASIEMQSSVGSSDPRRYRQSPVDAQYSAARWEPLPNAVTVAAAGHGHEDIFLSQTECSASNNFVAEQSHGFEYVPLGKTTTRLHASFSSKQGPPSEMTITPQVPFSLNQAPPSETTLRPQVPSALGRGYSDSHDSWTQGGGHNVMAVLGDKTQAYRGLGGVGTCHHGQPGGGVDGVDHCSTMSKQVLWI